MQRLLYASAFVRAMATSMAGATFTADRVGRQHFLMLTSLLGVIGTAALALASSPVVLAAAAFVGMVNGMGKDRGAALILERTTYDGRRDPASYGDLGTGHTVGAVPPSALINFRMRRARRPRRVIPRGL